MRGLAVFMLIAIAGLTLFMEGLAERFL